MDDQNDNGAATDLDRGTTLICTLLAEGWTQTRIGTEVNVSTKTIQRLLQVPAFSAELTPRRRASLAATTAALEYMGTAALGSLRAVLAIHSLSF